MSSGIYIITNIVNGKFYVGSAVNLEIRWRLHRNDLRAERHFNSLLQRSWTKYGEENFEFRTLLICRLEDLLMYEQRAIDCFNVTDKSIGFNRSPTAGRPLGLKWTEESRKRARSRPKRKGFKHTEQARQNMSKAQRLRKVWIKGPHARPWPQESRERMRQIKLGKKAGPYKSGNTLKTDCSRGHPYSGDNLYVHPKTGRRDCIACQRMREAKSRGK